MSKVAVALTMAIGSLAVAAPTASAAYESSWTAGCRGYWYTTSGHAYCKYSTRSSDSWYGILYVCDNESDKSYLARVDYGTEGKISTYECTFDIVRTEVS